jgi:hypothetical protein
MEQDDTRMHNRASQDVFDYWIHLCGERSAPLRTEIDPVALRRFLPNLFIAVMDEAGEMGFRLAGTRICELFGREFRGSPFQSIWADAANRRPLEIVENVIQYERPALMEVSASNGAESRAYELLLLPVRSDDVRSDRVLGALVPKRQPLPETALPATGLTLDNWTFLERHAARPQPDADDEDDRRPASRLRRLLQASPFSHHRPS